MAYIQRGPHGRVYTYPEVKALVNEAKKLTSEAIMKNQEPLNKALAADHERAMLTLCLRAVQLEGFQKVPMERLMDRVADMAEGLQAGKVDYDKDIRGPVEECLGYSIEDQALMERLEEEIT